MPNPNHTIAYFSLEIGLDASLPTYSGGLGVLAGDTIKAAADLGLPYAAVTLLYRNGYFKQQLNEEHLQTEASVEWDPEAQLEEMPQRAYVPIEGRVVHVRAYRLMLRGATGHHVPIYFLDTDLPENEKKDRAITHALYAGDTDHRIKQEAVLGIAGKRFLRAATHDVVLHHMNEGHAVFVTVELLSEHLSRFDKQKIDADAIAWARDRCVFTTHTPVPAGHDRFSIDRVRAIIGDHPAFDRADLYGGNNVLNTTVLALNLSRFANGVAIKHGEVSRRMFPGYDISSVTNGVHAGTWTSPQMAALYDRHLPGWRTNNAELRRAVGIPDSDILEAHAASKAALIEHVNTHTEANLEPNRFTIAFARRSTAYKRPAMLVSDTARLIRMSREVGPIQIIYAGKAHPHDHAGKEIIQQILRAGQELAPEVPLAFVPNYDMDLAKLYTSGCDLWLNNPEPPLEASGTSGMKAALNGVPSLSTLDGWWLEGHVEGVTGWAIDGTGTGEALAESNAQSLYTKLERDILPLYQRDRHAWAGIMRQSIALNGSYFTTERMVKDYIQQAYLD